MRRLLDTIMSQFANSERLMAMLQNMNEDIDPTLNFRAFYKQIWDIRTAEGYGLDVWGRIVGVQRSFAGPSGGVTMDDEGYRTLILVKAMANITNCSIPSLNKLITALFGTEGTVFVRKMGTMSMAYIFNFIPSPTEQLILQYSGVLPKPTGVLVNLIWVYPGTFGFDGSGLEPWNQGTFYSGALHAL